MEQDAGFKDSAQSRESSTIGFPYLDLDDAIAVAKAIFNRGGGQSSIDQLAADLGHDTVNSGALRNKIAAAKTFSLVETSREIVRLTTLGFEIVEPGREQAASVQAFLKVPLYKATFDRFRGRQLPPDGALERTFAEMGVAKKQVAKARQVFQRSAEQAGFFKSGKDRLVEPSIRGVGLNAQPTNQSETSSQTLPAPAHLDVPELVAAMFRQLPPEGVGFPKDRRAKWLLTLENVMELVYGAEDY